jgi:hypothetical protein
LVRSGARRSISRPAVLAGGTITTRSGAACCLAGQKARASSAGMPFAGVPFVGVSPADALSAASAPGSKAAGRYRSQTRCPQSTAVARRAHWPASPADALPAGVSPTAADGAIAIADAVILAAPPRGTSFTDVAFTVQVINQSAFVVSPPISLRRVACSTGDQSVLLRLNGEQSYGARPPK